MLPRVLLSVGCGSERSEGAALLLIADSLAGSMLVAIMVSMD